jgi:hypothetical protein
MVRLRGRIFRFDENARLRTTLDQCWRQADACALSNWKTLPVRGITALVVVLALAGIASATPLQRDPWKSLHRPLRIPRLAPGAPCPTSPTQAASSLAPAFSGFVLGRGPVYAGAFPADAVIRYNATRPDSNGWYGFKVLWIVPPKFNGLVLIRGRQLDGPSRVRFARSYGSELRISLWGTVESAPGWGHKPSTETVPGAGCYGFQVDGRGFSRILVFRAEPAQ